MNNTLRHICYDLQTDLKQNTDDRELPIAKIAFYVLMVANRLKAQHIDKIDSGAFIHTFADVPVLRSAVNNGDIIKGRPYIELPKSIYDLDKDGGVKYIGYNVDNGNECHGPRYARIGFTRTEAGRKLERLYYSKYETPSPKNPYWYRIGNLIYLLGIENTTIDKVEIAIFSTFDPITTIDIDAPFDFPEELIEVLKRKVLDLGRFILMIPSERVNDGDNNPNGNVPTQKLISVNDAVAPGNNPQQ